MSIRSRSESPLLGAAEELVGGGSRCPLQNALLARKRAEQDAVLLANRLRLLRGEEEKTRKKVQETEKKTTEILEVQRRNDERRLVREAEERAKQAEEEELRQRQFGERAELQRKIDMKHRSIQQQKSAASAAVRQDREYGRLAIEQQRAEIDLIAAEKAERVRKMTQGASRNRAKSENAKHEAAQMAVRDRVIREEDECKTRMSEIARMEKEEAELISKLQRTQERHRVAYMKLEDALNQGTPTPNGGGTASSSSLHALPSSFNRSRPATPSDHMSASAACDAAVAVFHGASSSSSAGARPPRPRGSGSAVTPNRAHAGAGTKPAALPTGVKKVPPQLASTPKHSRSVMSSCSTASGGDNRTSCASGHSTPSSASAPQITYTTADGLQLDIPVEEDLDLASLLNA